MKRERLFYLDFVRALATIIIVLTHFNAVYLYTSPQMPEKAVITTVIGNIYIGDFGVSLFLIISGAALMYVYQERFEWKPFYVKRFFNIFPMFWIAFFISFLTKFFMEGGIDGTIPKYSIIYSILGMDSYVGTLTGTRNFFIVGEWFLGFIILFYLVFPLLRICINKKPVLSGIAAVVIFAVVVFGLNPPQASVLLPVRLVEIMFGMFFVKYIRKVTWPAAAVCFAVIVINSIAKPTFNNNLQVVYIGISAFVLLVYLSKYFQWAVSQNLCQIVCKYSYPVFIVHHVIILAMVKQFDLYTITRFNSYLLFLTCCCVIIPAAKLLDWLHGYVMQTAKLLMKKS